MTEDEEEEKPLFLVDVSFFCFFFFLDPLLFWGMGF
jgi:hypothetical protein